MTVASRLRHLERLAIRFNDAPGMVLDTHAWFVRRVDDWYLRTGGFAEGTERNNETPPRRAVGKQEGRAVLTTFNLFFDRSLRSVTMFRTIDPVIDGKSTLLGYIVEIKNQDFVSPRWKSEKPLNGWEFSEWRKLGCDAVQTGRGPGDIAASVRSSEGWDLFGLKNGLKNTTETTKDSYRDVRVSNRTAIYIW